jgi:hypothetical protein
MKQMPDPLVQVTGDDQQPVGLNLLAQFSIKEMP